MEDVTDPGTGIVEFHAIPIMTIVQAALIIVGVVLTLVQLRRGIRERQITNLLEITRNHREIWSLLITHPELNGLLSQYPRVKHPSDLTGEQRLFVNFLLLHMAAAHHATEYGVMAKNPSVELDIAELMRLPAVAVVWAEYRKFHVQSFVDFVDRAVAEHGAKSD